MQVLYLKLEKLVFIGHQAEDHGVMFHPILYFFKKMPFIPVMMEVQDHLPAVDLGEKSGLFSQNFIVFSAVIALRPWPKARKR